MQTEPKTKASLPNSRPMVRCGVRLEVAPDSEGMSRAAAAFIVARLRTKPDALLCLPSGASPVRVFELLVEEHRRDPRLFARARFIKLDEWGGLAMDDPASCETYLQTRLVQPLGISPGRYFAWDSSPADPAAECARVAAWLAANGPIDLCLLGIGTNGHLGLNEPDEALRPGPHVARLSEESVGHGMLAAARRAPRFGLTLGMGDLLQSRQILLLASGESKARQMERFFWGEVFTDCPASFLWLHPAVSVFADEAAVARVRTVR
jgi:galactosamine-6-phosphate isomerase